MFTNKPALKMSSLEEFRTDFGLRLLVCAPRPAEGSIKQIETHTDNCFATDSVNCYNIFYYGWFSCEYCKTNCLHCLCPNIYCFKGKYTTKERSSLACVFCSALLISIKLNWLHKRYMVVFNTQLAIVFFFFKFSLILNFNCDWQ